MLHGSWSAPNAHPCWSRWLLSVVHLRELDGFPTAEVTVPGATHELAIVALHPEHHAEHPEWVRAGGRLQYLRPLDVVEQFHVFSDQQAIDLAQGALLAVITRGLSPDQDFRRAWASTIAEMAQRLREEN